MQTDTRTQNTHRGWITASSHMHTHRNSNFTITQTNAQKKLTEMCRYTVCLPASIIAEHLWHQKWTPVFLQIATCVSCSGPLNKVCSKTHWIINSSLCSTHPSPASSVQHVWWQPSGCARNTLHVRPPSFPLISSLSAHGCRFVCACLLKDARSFSFYLPCPYSVTGCYLVLRRWSRWKIF